MNYNLKPVYTIFIAVTVGAAAFFGGIQYQKSQLSSQFPMMGGRFQNSPDGQGSLRGGGRINGAMRFIGSISEIDDTSLTVKSPDGSSRIIVLSDKTTYSKSTEGIRSDLKVGDNIAVFGSTNTDGSMTAQNVQIGFEGGMMRNPLNGSQSGSTGK